MKRAYIVLAVAVAAVAAYIVLFPPEVMYEQPRKSTKDIEADFYTIPEFKRAGLEGGLFRTSGYVVLFSGCPPCPDDADCIPCMPENIVISENNTPLEYYDLTENELIIFNGDNGRFEMGKKYSFLLAVKDYVLVDETVNAVELVSYEAAG